VLALPEDVFAGGPLVSEPEPAEERLGIFVVVDCPRDKVVETDRVEGVVNHVRDGLGRVALAVVLGK
jgi:hypothetical protein